MIDYYFFAENNNELKQLHVFYHQIQSVCRNAGS
jgi:hypothetical protein